MTVFPLHCQFRLSNPLSLSTQPFFRHWGLHPVAATDQTGPAAHFTALPSHIPALQPIKPSPQPIKFGYQPTSRCRTK